MSQTNEVCRCGHHVTEHGNTGCLHEYHLCAFCECQQFTPAIVGSDSSDQLKMLELIDTNHLLHNEIKSLRDEIKSLQDKLNEITNERNELQSEMGYLRILLKDRDSKLDTALTGLKQVRDGMASTRDKFPTMFRVIDEAIALAEGKG